MSYRELVSDQLASPDAAGLSPVLTIRKAFTAGGGGAPDDVVIYSANAPGLRILGVDLIISTAVALATATLRDATGGGGSAVSAALSAAAAVRVPDLVSTATFTIAPNGTLVLRRSDSGIAGEVVIRVAKT